MKNTFNRLRLVAMLALILCGVVACDQSPDTDVPPATSSTVETAAPN